MVGSDDESEVYREDDFCESSGGACEGRQPEDGNGSFPSDESGTSSAASFDNNFERSAVSLRNEFVSLVRPQLQRTSHDSSCSQVTPLSRETLRGSHKSLDSGSQERLRDGSRTGSKKSLDSGIRRHREGDGQSNKSIESSHERLASSLEDPRTDQRTSGWIRRSTSSAAPDLGVQSRGHCGVSRSSCDLGSHVDVERCTVSASIDRGCSDLGLTTELKQAALQGGCGRGFSTSVPCGARVSRPPCSAGRLEGECRRLPSRPVAPIPVAPQRREQDLGEHISALFESLQQNLDAKLGRLEGRLDRVEDQQRKFIGVCGFNGGNRGSRPGSCKRAPSHCAAWRPAGKAQQHSRPERRSGGGGAWPVSRRPASAPRRRRGQSWRPESVRRCRALHHSWPH